MNEIEINYDKNNLVYKINSAFGFKNTALTNTLEPEKTKTFFNDIKKESGFLQKIKFVKVKNFKGEALSFNTSAGYFSNTKHEITTELADTYDLLPVSSNYIIKDKNLDEHGGGDYLIKKLKKQMKEDDYFRFERHGFQGEERVANGTKKKLIKGWLYKIKDLKADVCVTSELKIGEKRGVNEDYKNLDAVVSSLKNLIKPEHRSRLEVFISSNLLDERITKHYNSLDSDPAKILGSEKIEFKLAGLDVTCPEGIGDNKILVADPSCLAIYIHEKIRFKMEQDYEQKATILYRNFYFDYVIENFNKVATALNIKMLK